MARLVTYFRHDEGRRRLLEQPGDVQPRDRARRGRRLAEAGSAARSLFEAYRGDLATALSIAGPWLEGNIAAQEARGLSRDEAVAAAFNKRAAGAAAHPKVVWIVRSYWLAADRLAREGRDGDVAYPEEVLLLWLEEAGEEELARLVCSMPYWPVGLDAEGRWV